MGKKKREDDGKGEEKVMREGRVKGMRSWKEGERKGEKGEKIKGKGRVKGNERGKTEGE